jgi:hypothetical protein
MLSAKELFEEVLEMNDAAARDAANVAAFDALFDDRFEFRRTYREQLRLERRRFNAAWRAKCARLKAAAETDAAAQPDAAAATFHPQPITQPNF